MVAHNLAIATAPNPIQSRRELERGDGLQASLASIGFCSRLFALSIALYSKSAIALSPLMVKKPPVLLKVLKCPEGSQNVWSTVVIVGRWRALARVRVCWRLVGMKWGAPDWAGVPHLRRSLGCVNGGQARSQFLTSSELCKRMSGMTLLAMA